MTVISIPIQASGHDGDFIGTNETNGSRSLYNTTITNGQINSATNWNTGFYIFSGIPIPQASTINSGSIILTCAGPVIGTAAMLRIAVVDSGSAIVPTTALEASGQPKTGLRYWNIPAGTTIGNVMNSVDITPLLQSVINRSDWIYNNNIAVYIGPSGGYTSNVFSCYAWDHGKSSSSGTTPRLSIDYTPVASPIYHPSGSNPPLYLYVSGANPPSQSGTLSLVIGNQCLDALRPSGDYLLNGSGKFTNSINTTTQLWSYIDESVVDTTDSNYIQITQSGASNKPQYLYYIGTDSGNTTYRLARRDINTLAEKVYQDMSGYRGGLGFDAISDYAYFTEDQGLTNSVSSQRMEFPSTYASVPSFTLDKNMIVGNLTDIKAIEIDYENNRVYFIHNTAAYSAIYSCSPDGSNLTLIKDALYPWQYNSIKIDHRNQRLHLLMSIASPYAGYLGSVQHKVCSLDGVTTYNTNNILTTPTGALTANAFDIDIDYINNNTYISVQEDGGSSVNARIIKYTGISTLGTGSGTIVASGDYFAISPRTDKLYYNLMDSSAKGRLVQTNMAGTSTHTLMSSGYFTYLNLDAPVYKTFAEFDLTDPLSTLGISDAQMYSDVTLRIKGKTIFPSGVISVQKNVAASLHDGYWQLSGPTPIVFDNTGGNMSVQYSSPNTYGSFICFSGISIPNGAIIQSGGLILYNENTTTSSPPTQLKIRAYNSGSAIPPTSYVQASGQPKTSPIYWNMSNTLLGYVNTPELTSIIQSVINRSDWTSNNNLMFYIEPSGDTTTTQLASFRTFNFGAPYIPQLNINWISSDLSTSGTFITGKIITGDGANLLWSSRTGQFTQSKESDGLTTYELTGPNYKVNPNYNSRSDWNNARLHIDFSFLNNVQQSGVFQVYATEVAASCSGALNSTGSSASGLNIYIHGYGASSGSIPLYTVSNFTSSGINLFEAGGGLYSGILPITISGGYPNATLPLYLMVASGVPITDTIKLFTFGTSKSGVYDTMPLYLGINDYQEHSGTLPIYLNAYGTLSASSVIPLYMNSIYPVQSNSLNLFVKNTGFGSGIPLYVKGTGYGYNTDDNYLASDGALPYFGNMPLYIQRKDENKTMTLFIKNQQTSGNLSLYAYGNNSPSGTLSMVICNNYGSSIQPINLYTHGF